MDNMGRKKAVEGEGRGWTMGIKEKKDEEIKNKQDRRIRGRAKDRKRSSGEDVKRGERGRES